LYIAICSGRWKGIYYLGIEGFLPVSRPAYSGLTESSYRPHGRWWARKVCLRP
ncbi:hypothetical protein COCMIDRAFT_99160, partial [Bipolaris oryzae ATCC 44560]